MKKILLWLSVLLAILPLGATSAAANRPNILLAIGDNWAWPHAGALGDPTAKTPVFDRIAREGMLFNHAFCPVPSCSPTRSSMLTGRYAHQLEDAASLWSAFPGKLRVFTDLLREGGYAVGFTGKGWSPGNYLDHGWKQNPVGQQFTSFEKFMQERDKDRPFFFWLGNVDTALHRWRKEAETGAAPGVDSVRVPPMLPDVPDVRKTIAAYYAGVQRMDSQIGTAIEALEKAGLLDSTVVVYTSDNGWQMPRGLANCYDTGCRVPLAIRWPGKIKPASRSEAFVSLADLTPTFLEIAGLKPKPEMTAHSFLDLLLGQPGAGKRDHVFLERERHANVRRGNLSYPIRAIRTREFLYLWNLRPDRWPAGDPQAHWAVGDYGDVDPSPAKQYILDHTTEPAVRKFYDLSFAKRPEEELYDLRKDPDQLVNVAGQREYADAKRRLRARVEQWMRDTADPRVDPKYDGWDKYPYFGQSTSGKKPK